LRGLGGAAWRDDPPRERGLFCLWAARFFGARCAFFGGDARGLGKASAALAGCAVHARGVRSLGANARGFGRRLNRAIPIGMMFGFWSLRLLARLRRRGLAGWPPRERGALFVGRAFFWGDARGLGKQARRLQAARYMRVARGVWGRRHGDSVADKSGNSDWDDFQPLVLALACAA